MTEPRTFSGHRLYQLLTALCVLLALAFGWQLFTSWDWGELLFLGLALWLAARCVILMSSKVIVGADRVRVQTPLRTPREVEFRQITEVHEEGRGLRSVLVLYHPRNDAGIVTIDELLTLALPAVNDHEALLAALQAQVSA